MLKIEYGDIFSSRAQVLVNPVNRVGVMGAGLAKEFKRRSPSAFQEYAKSCRDGEIKNGGILFSPIRVGDVMVSPNLWVLHFPTKNHWKEPSDLQLIENGLSGLLRVSDILKSVAFPALGCGLGGLSWETQVLPLMTQYLDDAPFESTVYLGGTDQRWAMVP